MAQKATFTLDELTLDRLRITSERLQKPKSEIVREAIAEYYERAGRLSDTERRKLLRAFDTLVPAIPGRPAAQVDRELRDIRDARRDGGRGAKRRKKSRR